MQVRRSAATVFSLTLLFVCIGIAYTNAQDQARLAQGRDIYLNYCASCHGLTARGNGPVAPALRKRPSDLTRIRKKDGKFPAADIKRIITGEMVLPVHGAREMPVWGSLLREAELTSLVSYLESIQRFPDRYTDRD